jgi:hypothetical protein
MAGTVSQYEDIFTAETSRVGNGNWSHGFGKAHTIATNANVWGTPRLRVGYGRAAHLIDLMERDGIVGAADGPKPREVLKRPDWISEVEESMR